MDKQLLTQIGLEPDQALVYEIMLKTGPSPARQIAMQTHFKRPYIYKVLDELIALGLAEKKEAPRKVAIFSPLHPIKLKKFAEEKLEKAQNAKKRLEGSLSELISDFNLVYGKPNMQFFEGNDGVLKVMEDSLTAKDEIYSYVDSEAVDKYFPNENEAYIKKRNKLDIKKKIIYADGRHIRSRGLKGNSTTTEARVLPGPPLFGAVMQIYNQKVSFVTLEPDKIIGVIIEHPNIAQMQRSLFAGAWQAAKPLSPLPNPPQQRGESDRKLV